MTQQPEVELDVKVDNDRLLKVEVTGDPYGAPVFLLHGTPGSRKGPKPRASVLYRLGVRLVTFDRPGYGGSTRDEGRTVASAASDVQHIADELGIKKFAVVGRSGGGPHALACAALLPKSVTRVAVLVGVAPSNADDLDWYDGMVKLNVDEYTIASADAKLLADRLLLRADRTLANPGDLSHMLGPDLARPDGRLLGEVAFRRILAETYEEALRDGVGGWIDDVLALSSAWSFDLGTIRRPVLLWHGAEDNFSPPRHTRWLAAQMTHADVEVEVQRDAGHFGAVAVLPEILGRLVANDSDLVSVHSLL